MKLSPASPPAVSAYPVGPDFISNLRSIYSAEKYCVRRIPGLLNKLPKNDFWQLINNHQWVLNDRMARMEKISKEAGVSCNGAVCQKVKILIGNAVRIIYNAKAKNQSENYQELVETLLEISIFRSYIYNQLAKTVEFFACQPVSRAIAACLQEEDEFFSSLFLIKHNQSSSAEPFTVHLRTA